MRALRMFLRPGWIALGLVVIAFAVLCFSLLAPWQLGKSSSTEHRNELIRSAVSTPPAPIRDVLGSASTLAADDEWRAVTVTGRFDVARQVQVRLRSVGDQPAIEVLTPFVPADGSAPVLVNRGYVRPTQAATTAPSIPDPPAGDITIRGRLRMSEGTSAGRGAQRVAGSLSVYTIDPVTVGAATGLRMADFYLQMSPDQPGALGEIALPQLDSGPYLSYGLQWLAFGIMAPLGAAYFVYAEIRQRRRVRAMEAAGAGDAPPDTDDTHDTANAGADDPVSPPADLPVGRAESPRDAPAPGSGAAGPATRTRPAAMAGGGRRRSVRDSLRAASATTDGRQRWSIGDAPTADDADDDVRDKLTRRYGD